MADDVKKPLSGGTTVNAVVPAQEIKVTPGAPLQQQEIDPSLPAKTTFQEDLTHAGQRDINRLWETTQGKIAVYVILGTIIIDGVVLVASIGLARDLTGAQASALGVVNTLAIGVMSFYFSRTNHTQVGGVGRKPNDEYKGR